MVPPGRASFRGNAQGNAQGNENATRKWEGVWQEQTGGVWHTPRPFSAVAIRVFRPRPDDLNRASGEGRDGSDPPFLTAGAVRRMGGVWHAAWHAVWHIPPAFVGVAPVLMYPAGRLPGPHAGRTTSSDERCDA